MSYYRQDSVFWVEVDKISANPYQPRREFNQEELQSLANSIRQYGVLQALVVTRKEVPKKDGGLAVEYELISGERRLRASKLAGIKEVPVLIREGGETDLMKLELAIIENLQREDLNVVERARAFEKLSKEFSLNKTQIAKKVGKSREYVSNSMRVLSLPQEILDSLSAGKLSEGHARPLLMLIDKPDEQQTLFKEILYKKISVREAERIAKKIAKDRVRKPTKTKPEIEALEKEFTDSLGTRVNIESREVGGKISIDYFSDDDLHSLLEVLKMYKKSGNAPMLETFIAEAEKKEQQKADEKSTPQKESEFEERKETEEVLNESEKPLSSEERRAKIKEEINRLSHSDIPEPESTSEVEKEEFASHSSEESTVPQKNTDEEIKSEDTEKKNEDSEENYNGMSLKMERDDDPLDFLLEDDEDEPEPIKEEQMSETVEESKRDESANEEPEVKQEDTVKDIERETDEEAQQKEAPEKLTQVDGSSETEGVNSKEESRVESPNAEEDESVQKEPVEERPVQEESVEEVNDEPKSIQEAIAKREEEIPEKRDSSKTLEEVVGEKFASSDSYEERNSENETEKERLEEILNQKNKDEDEDDDIYSVRNFSI